MRALVTGGAGFIGSNLVDRLIADGHQVAVVDDLSTGRRENVHGDAHLEVRDVADAGHVVEGADVIFHLAAQIDVRRSVEDPRDDLMVNAGGTVAVIEGARRSGAKVVLASTGGAIYGEAETVPTLETEPARPLSPYGMSKLAAEGYCRLYRDLYGLQSTVLRLANVYGPRQDPMGEGGVVAIFCARAGAGEEAVIFGDGRQTRDFIFVDDVVEAFLAAADHADFGPYNIGTGRETSVLQLTEQLRQINDRRFGTRHRSERPGEVRRSCLDVSLAFRQLGWQPKTDLAAGLEQTLAWMTES